MLSAGWMLRSIGARVHGTCGWLAYRLGLRSLARRRFERVLLLRGADFSAYLHLGRIAFDVGDYAGWRRELEHARRLDPERFSRLRHPLELFEPRLAGTSLDRTQDDDVDFDGTGARATWRSLRPSSATGGVAGARGGRGDEPLSRLDDGDAFPGRIAPRLPRAGEPGEADEIAGDAAAHRDDCASSAERERLGALGPIQRAELARCDLDELLRKLSG